MEQEQIQTEQELEQGQEQETPLDQPQNQGQPEVSIDFRPLYSESVRLRNEMEGELNRLRQEVQTLRSPSPTPQTEELTDADIEKYGTTGTIKRIVDSSIREALKGTMGEFSEMSTAWKRGQQIQRAEDLFFNNNPALIPYREQLSQATRAVIQNNPSLDPNSYGMYAYANIGQMVAASSMQQGQQNNASSTPSASGQQNTTPVNNPPRTAPVTNRGNPPSTPSTRRLTELERNAMKMHGYDPTKSEDIKKFFDIVENDEGFTV